jgi:hypothetical protein
VDRQGVVTVVLTVVDGFGNPILVRRSQKLVRVVYLGTQVPPKSVMHRPPTLVLDTGQVMAPHVLPLVQRDVPEFTWIGEFYLIQRHFVQERNDVGKDRIVQYGKGTFHEPPLLSSSLKGKETMTTMYRYWTVVDFSETKSLIQFVVVVVVVVAG